eukprot:3772328-Prymnesium_polylepis.1
MQLKRPFAPLSERVIRAATHHEGDTRSFVSVPVPRPAWHQKQLACLERRLPPTKARRRAGKLAKVVVPLGPERGFGGASVLNEVDQALAPDAPVQRM